MNPTTPRNRALTVVSARLFALAFSPLSADDSGSTKVTENTLRLAEGQRSPAADLEDFAWLAGLWSGEGLGGKVEESWTPPSAGSIVGTFKLIDVEDGKETPNFYEFMSIFEAETGLVLRLKHFHPDVTGWEEKNDFVTFPFVKAEGRRIYFGGLTYEHTEDDALHIYLAMRTNDGMREVEFHLERMD
ncbi:MAG: DUF6265 family protein [Acidobacteriota bacterium]